MDVWYTSLLERSDAGYWCWWKRSSSGFHLYHIMFAHELCHSQIEYLSLRLVDPTARRGILPVESLRVERSILLEKTERHAAQVPVLRERLPQIFNIQYWRNRKKSKMVSFLRRQESIIAWKGWIPAFAGMTIKGPDGLFTKPSILKIGIFRLLGICDLNIGI